MPEREYYRVELVIDTKGDEIVKMKLQSMDKFIEHTRKRGEMLNRMKVSPTVKLIDRISAPLRTIENRLGRLSRTVTHTTGSMVRALTSPLGLLGAAGGTWGAVAWPLKLSGNMEQAQIAMESMLGSADKAKSFLKDLTAFAVKTPFEMPQLMDASQMLMAFGFGAEKVLPALTAVGNAASGVGLGAEGINRIVIALGQMKAKAKVSAEEMLQLTEARIPAWQILSDAMGISTAKLMKMVERGLLPANKAIDILLEGMSKRFPNMMARQSRSLFGLASTIKDAFNIGLLVRWGDGLSKAVKPRLERLVDLFTKNEEVTKRWGDVLEKTAFQAGNRIMTWFERTFEMIDQKMRNPAFERLDWAGKLTAILGNVAADVVPKATVIGIKIGWELGKGIGRGILQAASEDRLTAAVLGLLVGSKMPGPLPVKIIVGGAIALQPITHKLLERETYWSPYHPQTKTQLGVSHPTPFLPALPSHAFGGLFNRPHLGLFAEEGPEAIIPLSSKTRSRALGLWQETGRQLGVRQYAVGGFTAPVAAAGAGMGAPVINLNFDLSGLVGQIVVETGGELNRTADEVAAVVAKKLKRIFNNLAN